MINLTADYSLKGKLKIELVGIADGTAHLSIYSVNLNNAEILEHTWDPINVTQGVVYEATVEITTIGGVLVETISEMSEGRPDLAISEILFSDDEPTVGDEINITAIIKNAASIAVANVNVSFYKKDGTDLEYIGSVMINLGAQGTKNATITWEVDGKDLVIVVIVDPDNLIDETNEENNELEADLDSKKKDKDKFLGICGPTVLLAFILGPVTIAARRIKK